MPVWYDLYNKSYFSYKEAIMGSFNGKYACTATVGEKGQIVIPKQARELFGIKPGDTLILLCDKKRGIAIPPKAQFESVYNIVFEGDDK